MNLNILLSILLIIFRDTDQTIIFNQFMSLVNRIPSIFDPIKKMRELCKRLLFSDKKCQIIIKRAKHFYDNSSPPKKNCLVKCLSSIDSRFDPYYTTFRPIEENVREQLEKIINEICENYYPKADKYFRRVTELKKDDKSNPHLSLPSLQKKVQYANVPTSARSTSGSSQKETSDSTFDDSEKGTSVVLPGQCLSQ